jgi:hypothetical protein
MQILETLRDGVNPASPETELTLGDWVASSLLFVSHPFWATFSILNAIDCLTDEKTRAVKCTCLFVARYCPVQKRISIYLSAIIIPFLF